MTVMERIFTERNRAIAYRLIAALSLPAIFYGVVTEQEAAVWLAALAQALGIGLAVKHTSTKPEDSPGQ